MRALGARLTAFKVLMGAGGASRSRPMNRGARAGATRTCADLDGPGFSADGGKGLFAIEARR